MITCQMKVSRDWVVMSCGCVGDNWLRVWVLYNCDQYTTVHNTSSGDVHYIVLWKAVTLKDYFLFHFIFSLDNREELILKFIQSYLYKYKWVWIRKMYRCTVTSQGWQQDSLKTHLKTKTWRGSMDHSLTPPPTKSLYQITIL